jgi:hypothetical protein
MGPRLKTLCGCSRLKFYDKGIPSRTHAYKQAHISTKPTYAAVILAFYTAVNLQGAFGTGVSKDSILALSANCRFDKL